VNVRYAAHLLVLALATVPAIVAYAAMLGLGLHRHAPAWVISFSATVLVFGPPLVSAALAWRGRVPVFALLVGTWSLGILSAMPVYFPGERRQAVVTGMSLVNGGDAWENVAQVVADTLPEEPRVATPEVPEADEIVEVPLAAAPPLLPEQIALPYEGAGRRLSLPIVFEQGGKSVEREMMLDTGATYTTLPLSVLKDLGVIPGPDDPRIVLHTANGEREAQVVLVETVWLGDLAVHGVAVATCEACASSDTVGLLGLNVTGNFNITIDADRREVVLSPRQDDNRRLDASPFLDLQASLSRYPGGRMEVEVNLDNRASRDLTAAQAEIRCGDRSFSVDLPGVLARKSETIRRRLPEHEPCERYQVALLSAKW
jgi:hypothetical protein